MTFSLPPLGYYSYNSGVLFTRDELFMSGCGTFRITTPNDAPRIYKWSSVHSDINKIFVIHKSIYYSIWEGYESNIYWWKIWISLSCKYYVPIVQLNGKMVPKEYDWRSTYVESLCHGRLILRIKLSSIGGTWGYLCKFFLEITFFKDIEI